MAQPVIIDTDIGTDTDDAWAVAMALRCASLPVDGGAAAEPDVITRSPGVAR